MSEIVERAKVLRAIIENVMEKEDDLSASKAPELFAKMKYDGKLIISGTRIRWKDEIKKAAADLWDTVENDPENAPELWKDINYVNGIRVIPEAPSAADAFEKDEKGFWRKDGKIYKSLIPANVYTPENYPKGWEAEE